MVAAVQTSKWKTDRKLRARDLEGGRLSKHAWPRPLRSVLSTPELLLSQPPPGRSKVTARGAPLSSPHAHLPSPWRQRHLERPLVKQVSRPYQWTVLSREACAASSLLNPSRLKAALRDGRVDEVLDLYPTGRWFPRKPLMPSHYCQQ